MNWSKATEILKGTNRNAEPRAETPKIEDLLKIIICIAGDLPIKLNQQAVKQSKRTKELKATDDDL